MKTNPLHLTYLAPKPYREMYDVLTYPSAVVSVQAYIPCLAQDTSSKHARAIN
jgi:hypothetical protein